MNCQKVYDELAFLFADEELDGDLLDDFQRHLDRCPRCARTIRTTTNLLAVVRTRVERSEAPSALRTRIMAALAGDTPDSR